MTELNPAFFSPVPPAFLGHPILHVLTVFSLMLVTALSLEWSWRVVWAMVEAPQSFKSPASVVRWISLLLMISILIRVGPDVVLFGGWGDLTPRGRFFWAVLDKRLDVISFVPFSLAWLASHLGSPMVFYQLSREPLPVHLWPTWQQLKRPAKIGVGVFAIAFALTYLR